MGTYRMIPRDAYHKPFMTKFPKKYQWQNRLKPDIGKGLVWYTDGSKTNVGIGTVVCRWSSRRSIAPGLGSVLQCSRLKYVSLKLV
jgi:hypothetical protein